MEAWKWKTLSVQRLEVKVNDGILIKLQGKFQRKYMLFWCYLAARTINEIVKSLRFVVQLHIIYQGKVGT